MWPFSKQNVERTPWDDLADYLASSDIKFDMDSSTGSNIIIVYNNKLLRLDLDLNLYHNDVYLNCFLGKRYRVCTNAYRQYQALHKKNVENKLYCDLFGKCDEQ